MGSAFTVTEEWLVMLWKLPPVDFRLIHSPHPSAK